MSRSPADERMLRLTQANKTLLKCWAEGVHLQSASKRTIDDLVHQAAADRLAFADEFLRAADRLMRIRPPEYRNAISRYYYAMYHAMRAVVFFCYAGDDHQEHKKLPDATPDDFPDSATWTNGLKSARNLRNEADYDPYPNSDALFQQRAVDLRKDANQLLAVSRGYLKSKGCSYV